MSILQELHEAANRNEQMKAILGKAIDLAVNKFKEYFPDDLPQKVHAAFDAAGGNIVFKRDMIKLLQKCGVGGEDAPGAADEVAQFILNQYNKLDNEQYKTA